MSGNSAFITGGIGSHSTFHRRKQAKTHPTNGFGQQMVRSTIPRIKNCEAFVHQKMVIRVQIRLA